MEISYANVQLIATVVLTVITFAYVVFTYQIAKQGKESIKTQRTPLMGITMRMASKDDFMINGEYLAWANISVTNMSKIAATNIHMQIFDNNSDKVVCNRFIQYIIPEGHAKVLCEFDWHNAELERNHIVDLDDPYAFREMCEEYTLLFTAHNYIILSYENPYGEKYTATYKRPEKTMHYQLDPYDKNDYMITIENT